MAVLPGWTVGATRGDRVVARAVTAVRSFLVVSNFSVSVGHAEVYNVPGCPGPRPDPLAVSYRLTSGVPPPGTRYIATPMTTSMCSCAMMETMKSGESL